MPSSISSSSAEGARDARGWVIAGTVAILGFAVLLGAAEIAWRWAGHRPSIVDDFDSWALERARASEGGAEAVALVGMSRIQLGVSLAQLEREFPGRRFVQLAIFDTNPLATLRDLASDPSFTGTMVASISAPWIREGALLSQGLWVEHYRHRFGTNAAWNRRIASALQSRLALLNPQLNPARVLSGVLSGEGWPEPLYFTALRNRAGLADYDREGKQKWRTVIFHQTRDRYRNPPSPHPNPEEFQKTIDDLLEIVADHRKKGGHTILFRMPTGGMIWKMDERHYPRKDYWDPLARQLSEAGAPSIHFHDVPEMRAFRLPDSSHIDAKDVPAFTELFACVLAELGGLERSPDAVAGDCPPMSFR